LDFFFIKQKMLSKRLREWGDEGCPKEKKSKSVSKVLTFDRLIEIPLTTLVCGGFISKPTQFHLAGFSPAQTFFSPNPVLRVPLLGLLMGELQRLSLGGYRLSSISLQVCGLECSNRQEGGNPFLEFNLRILQSRVAFGQLVGVQFTWFTSASVCHTSVCDPPGSAHLLYAGFAGRPLADYSTVEKFDFTVPFDVRGLVRTRGQFASQTQPFVVQVCLCELPGECTCESRAATSPYFGPPYGMFLNLELLNLHIPSNPQTLGDVGLFGLLPLHHLYWLTYHVFRQPSGDVNRYCFWPLCVAKYKLGFFRAKLLISFTFELAH
jgi:hypothetical protein